MAVKGACSSDLGSGMMQKRCLWCWWRRAGICKSGRAVIPGEPRHLQSHCWRKLFPAYQHNESTYIGTLWHCFTSPRLGYCHGASYVTKILGLPSLRRGKAESIARPWIWDERISLAIFSKMEVHCRHISYGVPKMCQARQHYRLP